MHTYNISRGVRPEAFPECQENGASFLDYVDANFNVGTVTNRVPMNIFDKVSNFQRIQAGQVTTIHSPENTKHFSMSSYPTLRST